MARFQGTVWDDVSEYETVSGDTWDLIALRLYGDEHLAPLLIYVNPRYADIIIFDGGESIRAPVIRETEQELAPPWKRIT